MNDYAHNRARGDRAATLLAASAAAFLALTSAHADSPCGCSADYDGSGSVDAADLAILLGFWSGNHPSIDLSGNGWVEASDLGILLGQWGPCPGPANDICQSAQVLPSVWSQDVPFCTANANTDGPPNAACSASGTDQIFNDVYFKIIAPTDGLMQAHTCPAEFDTRLAVYQPGLFGVTCPSDSIFSASLLACNDDMFVGCGEPLSSLVLVPVEAGTTYTIRVGGYLDGEGIGDLAVDFFQRGDFCTDAIPVQLTDNGEPEGATVILSGDTLNATSSVDSDPNSCGGPNDSKDLWFKLDYACTVGGAQPVSLTVSTCLAGTDFDTTLTVYTGGCGSLTEVECNDDSPITGCQIGGFNRRSFVSLDPTLSSGTYWVRLAGYNGAVGQYQIKFNLKCLD
jgi:hypothetical protein